VDTTEILGLPIDSLPPEAQAALTRLLAEIDHLRQDLAIKGNHEAWLERLADRHGLLPILNRRALMRELTRAIHSAIRSGAPSAFLMVALDGLQGIRMECGLAAADAATEHAIKRIGRSLFETDVFGSLGWGGFGILLAGASAADGARRAHELTRAIEAEPFVWEGRSRILAPRSGVAEIGDGDDAARVIGRADQALRDGIGP
jgi:diguanylate cyclase (GGDEF)-like protein